jgi:hypothetical protein
MNSLGDAITNPSETLSAIGEGLEARMDMATSGNPMLMGQVVGEAIAITGEVLLGTKGAGAVTKSVRVADSAADVAGAAKSSGSLTKQVIDRNTRGADGGTSRHIVERIDGKTNSVTHQVSRDGKIVHQHQTHMGKYGTHRQFPDDWLEHPTIPAVGQ